MANVFLIDDDPNVLDAVGALVRSFGFAVQAYDSAETFLAAPYAPGCIVSDLRMPGLGGLELVGALQQKRDPRTIILLTAHGDINLAVQALKLGAFDFLEKPFDDDRLLGAIASGLERSQRVTRQSEELSELRRRYDSLSRRQKEVLWLIVAGCPNKEISARLQISVRTVETYRAWVLERMQARSLADLVKISVKLEAASATTHDPTSVDGTAAGSQTP